MAGDRRKRGAALLVVLLIAGCAQTPANPENPGAAVVADSSRPVPPAPAVSPAPAGAQPKLAAEPDQLGRDLVADERALADPSTSAAALTAAARRQQAAYRLIARSPDIDAVVRPGIPADLADGYHRNVNAIQQLTALATPLDTLPAWRIQPPAPVDELRGHYREAEAAFGVGWNYLAAINFVETRFGRIVGDSSAGAQGPMQFMPGTWAAYGAGGDVRDPRDAMMGAARYLAANNFAGDPDGAIFRYNNSQRYVAAVNDYAAVLAADAHALGGYHRWEVYYKTTAGDVLLPVGYQQAERIPVADYLADHPQ
ncbi:transglycosylase SLT domain-containing protein [Mycolicibacterium brumae]